MVTFGVKRLVAENFLSVTVDEGRNNNLTPTQLGFSLGLRASWVSRGMYIHHRVPLP